MRTLRRNIAWVLLAGFVSAQGTVWVAAHHATLEDDAACAAMDGLEFVGPHHQAGLQIEETNPPSPIEHCAICHLQRHVRGALLSRVTGVTPPADLVRIVVEQTVQLAPVVLPALPSRGPPSLLT